MIPTFDVRLSDIPRPLFELSWERTEELAREFRLMAGGRRDVGDLPDRVTTFLTGVRTAGDGREVLLGVGLDQPGQTDRFDTVLTLPVGAETDAVRLAQLMDEADCYCSRGDVLTLERPASLVALRWWQATEIVRQRHGLPATPFTG